MLQKEEVDFKLLAEFREQLEAKVPRVEEGRVVNPTPFVDLTDVLMECARAEYSLKLDPVGVRVYGKLDSKIHGGSVKVRPAMRIIGAAIESGELVRGQTVFEATSGNFGLALGMLSGLGLRIVALVSRRLQPGVVGKMKADGVQLIDLDIDVCPAPGVQGEASRLMARATAASVRQQLKELGFDPSTFDGVEAEAVELLARQDAIALAKLLATAYGGFCPGQYDNELNAGVHEGVTGPEIDQQLKEVGSGLHEADVICALGTGGTASGLSVYATNVHGRKAVRVVYPISGQDVAGIRTKEKAQGLKFYEPGAYLGEQELDFEQARRVFDFFNTKGHDVGESGALALYGCLQLLNLGLRKTFVVMVADGASKYVSADERTKPRREQVRLQEAASSVSRYAGVVWVHAMFVPSDEGVEVIARSLGCDRSAVKVADVRDVQAVVSGREPSEEFDQLFPSDGRPVILVCMAGGTSLMVAKALARKGVAAESLMGGITGLPLSNTVQASRLIRMSRG